MADKPLVLKTTAKAWVFDAAADTVTQITDVNYPATTVPGIVYLDGTYYVMAPNAEISASDLDDPTVWPSANVLTAETETDTGVMITKYLNYLVAFGQWTTEFFYDAENATGSPLARAENMFLPIGCAHAKSVQQASNTLIWFAQAKEGNSKAGAGRSVMMLAGTEAKEISSPAACRYLDADDLSGVYSLVFTHQGHTFYILTLTNTAVSLVYDLSMELWYLWTSLTAQDAQSVTSLTYSSTTGLVTATCTTHGSSDGDVRTIAGATPDAYNGTFNITYVDANTFTYEPTSVPASTPATGTITSVRYTESYFKLLHHTATAGVNLFADNSSGRLFAMTETDYDDNGVPINKLIRTKKLEGSSLDGKPIGRVELVGDKATGNVLIRCSKDDYQTFTKYRKADLSLNRTRLSRFGRASRVSFDVRVTDNIPVRFERLDLDMGE